VKEKRFTVALCSKVGATGMRERERERERDAMKTYSGVEVQFHNS
jgi:hypothetical protein